MAYHLIQAEDDTFVVCSRGDIHSRHAVEEHRKLRVTERSIVFLIATGRLFYLSSHGNNEDQFSLPGDVSNDFQADVRNDFRRSKTLKTSSPVAQHCTLTFVKFALSLIVVIIYFIKGAYFTASHVAFIKTKSIYRVTVEWAFK